METWKPFHNYLISDYGRVMNHKGKVLKLFDDRRGYLKCNLSVGNGKPKTFKVHFLVMKCFVGDRPIDPTNNKPLTIDHIDRDKYNNCLTNLRYATYKEQAMNKSTYHSDIEEQDPIQRRRLIYQKKRNLLIK